MKDQVFMSPNNGYLVVGIPLFRRHQQELQTHGHSIYLVEDYHPLAYVIEADGVFQVLAAEWVENNLICLGEL